MMLLKSVLDARTQALHVTLLTRCYVSQLT